MPASISAQASMIFARQAFGTFAEKPFELPQRLAPLHLGLGVDQVGKTFDLGEIELAVFKAAPRELARLGWAQTIDARERVEQRRDDRLAAMDVKLRDIFAGGARRPGNHSTSASSIGVPSAPRKVARVARRAIGRPAPKASSAGPARGPDILTTAIADRGRPDDSAKIVSEDKTMAYLSPVGSCRQPMDGLGH